MKQLKKMALKEAEVLTENEKKMVLGVILKIKHAMLVQHVKMEPQ